MRRIALFMLLGGAAGCATCQLPGPPESGEARASTSLPGDQWEPAAAQSARSSVVVWSDGGTADTGRGIFGQRFDASGRRDGDEFRVDAAPGAPSVIARRSDVAMNADGASVVVWEVYDAIADVRVFARRYGSDGRALGMPTEVTMAPTRRTAKPSVAISASGAFAVAWHAVRPGTQRNEVFVRRYSAQGQALGEPVRVDSTAASNQGYADVAMTPGGAFVATWFDGGLAGRGGVLARRFGRNGEAVGDTFRVHTPLQGQIDQAPAVAVDASGAFIVAWHTVTPLQPNHGIGITAQRFNPSGQPEGAAVSVSPPSDSSQTLPAVALDPGGRALVTWQRARVRDHTASVQQDDVWVQRLGPEGRLGPLFRVNEASVGYLRVSAIAMDPAGNVLVAWDATRPDGHHLDVYARRYRRR